MKRYLDDKTNINIIVSKEEKERYLNYAKEKGISLTQLIKHCLNLEIAQDNYAKEHAEDYKEDIENLKN